VEAELEDAAEDTVAEIAEEGAVGVVTEVVAKVPVIMFEISFSKAIVSSS